MKTTNQVAVELGVKRWQIRHAYDAGYLDRPASFAGRLVYADADIANLKTYFSRKEHDDTTLEDLLNR